MHKSPAKLKKRASLPPLRGAVLPQIAVPTVASAPIVANPGSKNRRKRGHSIKKDISAEASMNESEDALNESLDNTHFSGIDEDEQFVYQDASDDEILVDQSSLSGVVAPLTDATPIVYAADDKLPTPTVAQPSLDIQHVGYVIKQSFSVRISHQKD